MKKSNYLPDKIKYKELGCRIRSCRMEHSIKQAKMAEDLGISNNHLSAIEHGKQKPSMDTFINICSYLQVSPDYLLLGTIHSYDLQKNLTDKIMLCEPSDRFLAEEIIELLANRGNNKNQ
ncbi:MAG: helix-turn-helix transcriptional regulator [Lachnospiraceae bacterium]|nr:helix-turn-helix transcriptional regulator [Lachnospiraceae bacterium]